MKKVGIIGCGGIHKVHVSAIEAISSATLTAVCDIKADRCDWAKEKGIAVFTDYKELILSGLVDTVHICTPHYLHCEMAVFALENGVDVLCEKPMAITLSDGEKMVTAANNSGRKLWIVFQNRFNPGAQFVKKALEDGTLGRVLGAKCEVTWHRTMEYYSDDWHGRLSSEGGGVIINQAIHTLDLMRWLIGEDAVSVQASISNRELTEIEVEDTAEGRIKFASGATAGFYFTNAYITHSPVRIELCCENGTALLEGGSAHISLNSGESLCEDESSDYGRQCGAKDYWGNSHIRQIAAFYGEAENICDNLAEALKTQKLMCKIYDCARR